MSLFRRLSSLLTAPEPPEETPAMRTARATVALMTARWLDGSNRVLGRAVVLGYGRAA